MYASILETPIGTLVVRADEQHVYFAGFPPETGDAQGNAISEAAIAQFRTYFEGKSARFDFPMQQPGTEFQQKVWQELRTIEAGHPISYAALSRRMNSPLAIRAIASANGRNDLMIAVPCHRVIGSNGD